MTTPPTIYELSISEIEHWHLLADLPRWPWCDEHQAPMMPSGGWCLTATQSGHCRPGDSLIVPLSEGHP